MGCGCDVSFRQLQTCRGTRPGRQWATRGLMHRSKHHPQPAPSRSHESSTGIGSPDPAREMTDAAAGVHPGFRERGGVAGPHDRATARSRSSRRRLAATPSQRCASTHGATPAWTPSEGHLSLAARTCLASNDWTLSALSRPPCTLGNNAAAPFRAGSLSHDWRAR